MTPKEKANKLVEKFRLNVLDYEGCSINLHKAKQCALIAVDEMEEVWASALVALGLTKEQAELIESNYLNEVKREIEKL